eukprot:TRINITY_DN8391_c0_g1_i1.p1 TRINITY_DN8391_c0_g1~~TRINITY_DN8391_c0_g1_i1.p1  ORF type:complete len:1241 (+),score=141.90 TRINITY_DN8391_c0_g1_i1:13388-17110(+)
MDERTFPIVEPMLATTQSTDKLWATSETFTRETPRKKAVPSHRIVVINQRFCYKPTNYIVHSKNTEKKLMRVTGRSFPISQSSNIKQNVPDSHRIHMYFMQREQKQKGAIVENVYRSKHGEILDVSRVKKPTILRKSSAEGKRIGIQYQPLLSPIQKEEGITLEHAELLESIGTFSKYKDEYYPYNIDEVEYFVKTQLGINTYQLHYSKGLTLSEVDKKVDEEIKRYGLTAYRNNVQLSDREECSLLKDWMEIMDEKYTGKGASVRNQQLILSFAVAEVIRMCKIECNDRGDLLQKVWEENMKIMKGLEDKTEEVEKKLLHEWRTKYREMKQKMEDEIQSFKAEMEAKQENEKNQEKVIKKNQAELDSLKEIIKGLKERCQALSGILDYIVAKDIDNRKKVTKAQKRRLVAMFKSIKRGNQEDCIEPGSENSKSMAEQIENLRNALNEGFNKAEIESIPDFKEEEIIDVIENTEPVKVGSVEEKIEIQKAENFAQTEDVERIDQGTDPYLEQQEVQPALEKQQKVEKKVKDTKEGKEGKISNRKVIKEEKVELKDSYALPKTEEQPSPPEIKVDKNLKQEDEAPIEKHLHPEEPIQKPPSARPASKKPTAATSPQRKKKLVEPSKSKLKGNIPKESPPFDPHAIDAKVTDAKALLDHYLEETTSKEQISQLGSKLQQLFKGQSLNELVHDKPLVPLIKSISSPTKTVVTSTEDLHDYYSTKIETPETELPKKLMSAMSQMSEHISSLQTDEYGQWLLDLTQDSELVQRILANGHLLTLLLRHLYPKKAEKAPDIRIYSMGVQTETIFTAETFSKSLANKYDNSQPCKETGVYDKQVQTEPINVSISVSTKMKTFARKEPVSNLRAYSRRDLNPKPHGIAFQLFQIGKLQQGLARNHPALQFLATFIEKYEKGDKNYFNVGTMSVKLLVKLIHSSYMEKMNSGKTVVPVQIQPLIVFLFESFINKYGLLNVAERKLKEIMLTAVMNRQKIVKIELFSRFIGLSEVKYSADDLWFYFSFIQKLFIKVYNTINTRREAMLFDNLVVASIVDIKSVVENLFEGKAELRKVVESMVEGIQVDEVCIKVIDLYKMIKRNLQESLITKGVAKPNVNYTDDYYGHEDYLRIMTLFEDRTESQQLFEKYSVYQENHEGTDPIKRICLESILSYILKNSLHFKPQLQHFNETITQQDSNLSIFMDFSLRLKWRSLRIPYKYSPLCNLKIFVGIFAAQSNHVAIILALLVV